MLMEGIQSTNLCKVRANSDDKPTSGVQTENKIESVYKMKYKINLDHQILTSSGVFYPQALDRIMLEKTVIFHQGTDADLNLHVNPQRRSLKGILLLFIEPYVAILKTTSTLTSPMLRLPSTESQTGFTTMASKGMTCGMRQAGYLLRKARNKVLLT